MRPNVQRHVYTKKESRSNVFPSVILTRSREEGPKRSHQLRYVLRNKSTGDVYLVVLFTLYLKDDVNEDGTLKAGADSSKSGHPLPPSKDEHESHDEEKALEEARKKMGPASRETETNADDVD